MSEKELRICIRTETSDNTQCETIPPHLWILSLKTQEAEIFAEYGLITTMVNY